MHYQLPTGHLTVLFPAKELTGHLHIYKNIALDFSISTDSEGKYDYMKQYQQYVPTSLIYWITHLCQILGVRGDKRANDKALELFSLDTLNLYKAK